MAMTRWLAGRGHTAAYIPVKDNLIASVSYPSRSRMRSLRPLTIAAVVLVVGVVLTALNIYELHQMQKEHMSMHEFAEGEGRGGLCDDKPIYAVHGKRVDSGYLKHVYAVFERLGYTRGSKETEWDVMWSHDYPFRELQSMVSNLKPHQKINHFPGSGYITNKVTLATSGIKYIPTSFKIPRDKEKLLQYAESYPEKMFVQKGNNHRGIQIEKLKDLDLEKNGSFVQEFISKPFLVDGFKFDIGIYTVLTSINPLRVYVFGGDVLFRFCPEKYYPFDPDIVDKYVIRDDYLPLWKVPSLQKYYTGLGFSMKESFNAHLKSKGKDPSHVWSQAHEAIRKVFFNKESALIHAASRYRSPHNFFELMRFDFVLDEDLNIYIMEANLSPNLSSAHFPPNRLLYEQVIYNALALVGVGRYIHRNSLKPGSEEEEDMQVSPHDVMVYPESCASEFCQSNCFVIGCSLCKHCLSADDMDTLRRAYREHINRHSCIRIVPLPMSKDDVPADLDLQGLTEENQKMHYWFQGRCIMDSSWC